MVSATEWDRECYDTVEGMGQVREGREGFPVMMAGELRTEER